MNKIDLELFLIKLFMSKSSETQITNILNNISKDYNIPLSDLVKYYDNDILSNNKKRQSICKARKQDGFQCTRKSKPTSIFCGKHIDNRRFGCVSNLDYIECRLITINQKKYYCDEFNFIYELLSEEPIKYKIVGMKNNNDIDFLK
jgi:hypothetical protein